MSATRNPGRVAGFLYLLLLTGVFNLIYVPSKVIVPGNATATAKNVLAHEMLFRMGIVSGLFSSVFFILLAMGLYRLLSGVNKTYASLMVVFVAVSAGISFLNEVNSIAALILFRGADFLAVFDQPQREALGMLFLRLHSQGNFVNEMFWGLWLFPFGVLVKRSRFLPRLLGILLIVNSFAYVAISLTWLLLPAYGPLAFRAAQPALMGELWILLWLLIKGAKVQPSLATASSSVNG